MKWTKPEAKEISLGMEMTAYVNTEKPAEATHKKAEPVRTAQGAGQRAE